MGIGNSLADIPVGNMVLEIVGQKDERGADKWVGNNFGDKGSGRAMGDG